MSKLGYKLLLLEEDKKQKVWKNWRHKHGIYSVEIPVNELYQWSKDCCMYNHKGNEPVYIGNSTKTWFLGHAAGNVKYYDSENGPVMIIIGRFSKTGSEVYINPLDYPYEHNIA
ncbi:hypothetical protein [Kosakonia phage Kc304]|uniref:Uncharacterized protein n=2 Tax=Winklervirus chi14 TaxID=2560752 RepID=A0A1Z1LYL7_9CAUD|nr:hypothetical protein FDI23_gp179 [Serratia phage CHI14]ARW57659.1 hypothetical protein [Serratia phage CHI14]ARW57934.1 hypothetical protein [Serratia phage CBH8]QYN80679.1 hypothetical protein [Kosakonia phage Kc304]